MSANLAANLTATVARTPDAVALKLDDLEVTFAQLDNAAARVAGHLASLGVGPGDRVGLMLPNVPGFASIYYGILRLGAVVVPMNVLLKERETSFYLSDPGAKAVFAWHDFADAAGAGAREAGAELITVAPQEFGALLAAATPHEDVAERAESDTAVILYTSGTTGTPKGAELTHSNLGRNAQVMQAAFDMNGEDVILGSLPLFHSFGQTCSLNAGIRAGATLTMLPRFDPEKALEVIERDRVTIFMGVPTMYSAILHAPGAAGADTSSLRVCVSGGASLPVELLRSFEERFGCIILEGYGLSETSPVASFNRPGGRKPGSIGVPIEGVEMRVVDDAGEPVAQGEVGEIVIRGHNVMKGYWNRPEATAEAIRDGGWFHSGDMARIDEDGFFFIVDRKKDLIIRGGYNVYPREIEEVIYEHVAVREAAVVGVPHDELGEEVAAFVALKEGAAASPEEIQTHVKDQVAAYKYPRYVWLIDDLPKGPTGKILKRELVPPV
jgi:long-chain acyl-CoA synthetase